MEQLIDNKTNTRDQLLKYRTQAIYAMMALKDVLCVSIGMKEVEGSYTSKLAYKVYVKKKLPSNELPKDQQIPSIFKGFPTDVVEMTKKQ